MTETMQTLILPGALGMVGGLTRGVVGLLKSMALKRKFCGCTG